MSGIKLYQFSRSCGFRREWGDMDWFFLTLVCAHLMIGLFCGHLAYETKQKAEPWFLAGTRAENSSRRSRAYTSYFSG